MKNRKRFLKSTLVFVCTLAMIFTSIELNPVIESFAEVTGGNGDIQYLNNGIGENIFQTGTVSEEDSVVNSTYERSGRGENGEESCFVESTVVRGDIQYRYYDTGEKAFKTGTVPEGAIIVDSTYDRTIWGDEDGKETWYVVKGEVNLLYIYANGKLNLVLCDNAKLTVEKGMVMPSNGSSINIYAQSDGADMGEIISTGLESKRPAIGTGDDGNVDGTTCTTNIHGGKITATGARSTAGIGGDSYSRVGIINIYGGEINA